MVFLPVFLVRYQFYLILLDPYPVFYIPYFGSLSVKPSFTGFLPSFQTWISVFPVRDQLYLVLLGFT